MIYENGGYPMGAQNDSNAPYNQEVSDNTKTISVEVCPIFDMTEEIETDQYIDGYISEESMRSEYNRQHFDIGELLDILKVECEKHIGVGNNKKWENILKDTIAWRKAYKGYDISK